MLMTLMDAQTIQHVDHGQKHVVRCLRQSLLIATLTSITNRIMSDASSTPAPVILGESASASVHPYLHTHKSATDTVFILTGVVRTCVPSSVTDTESTTHVYQRAPLLVPITTNKLRYVVYCLFYIFFSYKSLEIMITSCPNNINIKVCTIGFSLQCRTACFEPPSNEGFEYDLCLCLL